MRSTPSKTCVLCLSILLLLVNEVASPNAHSFAQEPAESMHTNHLANETSPYLLQHAYNPVNWYPWGEEAFAKAKREDKPIFLSVGYSTCYWCHVMEVESFESEEVAAVINEFFVPVKVDREERPDIDEQYMMATQLMTQRGGWPNSVWLMPDGRPWMAGTYFPKQRFIGYLKQTAEIWKTQRDVVEKQAAALVEATAQMSQPLSKQSVELNRQMLSTAGKQFISAFDETNGGFGTAPKFPPHGTLSLLIEHYRTSKDPQTLGVITRTLDAMWLGGMHDHIGGGYHRYSTDAQWLLPHFEKMLYDNAQLMRLYSDGFQITSKPLYREAVADIFSWARREMTSPEGAFYSALDSGEVGEEGEAYLWSIKQLEEVLGVDEATRFAKVYGFEEGGNFEEESTGKRTGKNIPHLDQPTSDEDSFDSIRQRLLTYRLTWPQPHRDDKVLVSWNGLMIDALAHAGAALDEPEYIQAATRAADFVLQSMTRDGRLLRSYRDGTAKIDGYLDDYAYFIRALLQLHTATGDPRWLENAVALSDVMLAEFTDPDGGGFFFTGKSHEKLIVRSKNLSGGGNLPNANGVAAIALIRIGELTRDDRYTRAARQTLESLSGMMVARPQASEHLLVAASMLVQQDDPKEPHSVRTAPVNFIAKIARDKHPRGGQATVTLTMAVDKGWHLYADNKDVDYVIPTKITLSDPSNGIKLASVQNAKTHAIEDPITGQQIQTYEGTCEFQLTLAISDDVPLGETRFDITVDFQACDDTRCLQPKKATLSIPLKIVR